MASARVLGSSRKRPLTAEVTVKVPGFFTPRIDMQRCSASTTTITPHGASASSIVSAICAVIRSWTWRRWAKESTTRRELGEPGDPTVLARYVPEVDPADERHHVVLTERRERDVAHHHQLVVLSREGHCQVTACVVVESGEQLGVHRSDTRGGAAQPLPARILAYRLEQLSHETFDTLCVDAHRVTCRSRGVS